MIKKALGMSGGGKGNAEVINKRFIRYMQPIVNPTKDAGALDSSQSWFLDVVETATEWRLLYTGANTQLLTYTPDGQDYINNDTTFMAIKTKSNNVLTGWNKVLDVNGDPKPLFKPSFVNDTFDEWQVWIRTVIVEDGKWKIWFIGDSGYSPVPTYPPAFSYRVGYAESIDEGLTYINRTTTPIYTDLLGAGEQGIVTLRVVHDDENYKMIYSGINPNTIGLFIAESANGTSGWTKTHSNLFANQEFGFISDFKYVSGTYYLWLQRGNLMPERNLGPCREVFLFSSTDLDNWTNLGVQMKIKNEAQEFGIGNHVKCLQKPNGEWFMIHTYYMNRTQALAGITKEPSPATKISESNNSDSFIMNSQCTFTWPSYVTFHAPLDFETGFTEEISGTGGVISGTGYSYAERGFIKLTGQTITFPNNGNMINGADFEFHFRVQTVTSGTHTLVKIGNDIWWTLESGKQRLRVSSDGVSYQKDYIATVNIGKPTGLDYIDNHVYIAVSCIGGVIRMWNEDCVTEITASITKTIDNALTSANNSGSDITIMASIEVRSLSICNGATATELTQLCI